MKILTKACVALLLIVTCFSCKKDIGTTDPQKNGAISSNKQGDTIIHKLMIDGNVTYVNEINGTYYYADDLTISKEQFNTLKKLTAGNLSTQERSTIVQSFATTWPNATVYYRYPVLNEGGLTAAQLQVFIATINTAFQNITNATGIQFIERTVQTEYLAFVKSLDRNNSPLGWQKDRVNTINLFNYNSPGITTHETLHSLGVHHEQCRPDRDQYVTVFQDRLDADVFRANFNKTPGFAGHGNFDFNSIMLYASTDFAIAPNYLPPMTKLDGTTFVKQRVALSPGDIAGLRSLYFPTEFNGIYKISPFGASTKSFDLPASSTADGTNITLYTSHAGNNQRFTLRKADHGYYQIVSNLDPTKVLTVRNASIVSGTQVELRTDASANNQKFRLDNRGNDGFSFAPKHAAGLRLAVAGGSYVNNTNIIVSTFDTNVEAQRFNLTKQ
ncbi:flavastacin [Pedobacter polaris]|uniref:Flavastacin n=1 Tax=Pedobacter polaris TaxID=2571273 RepID=A0A4U1CG33_9SPHI|nr:M12 family metallopeptidase [Pedobacter polaris]TKC05365.1 flavastacin [Pedobacter polaris]